MENNLFLTTKENAFATGVFAEQSEIAAITLSFSEATIGQSETIVSVECITETTHTKSMRDIENTLSNSGLISTTGMLPTNQYAVLPNFSVEEAQLSELNFSEKGLIWFALNALRENKNFVLVILNKTQTKLSGVLRFLGIPQRFLGDGN
ncbi:MAG: hypothetical protein QY304_01185 [Candidatus Paceibacterota bacterium]|nr:MAG: hypothetical protein QY304_01185 [Candidatus Paceibacterota bacterium]